MQISADVLDPLAVAEAWVGEGRRVAIATVIETWGLRRGRRQSSGD